MQFRCMQDAMQSLNSVVDAQLDAQAAFNLVLCTFALGDKEMMKQAFTRLIEVQSVAPHLSLSFFPNVRVQNNTWNVYGVYVS